MGCMYFCCFVFIQRSLRSRCTSAVIAAAICPSASGHWLARLCCATNSRASSAASEARSSGTSKLRSFPPSSPRETGSTNSVVGGDGGGGRGVITTASRGCASVSRTACATASTSVGPSGESSPCSRSATYQSATWRPAHPLASVYGSKRAWRRRKKRLRECVRKDWREGGFVTDLFRCESCGAAEARIHRTIRAGRSAVDRAATYATCKCGNRWEV